MPKLCVAAGRNELAVPQHRLLDLINEKGGIWPEKWVMKEMDKDLNPMEQISVIRHLCDTDQLARKQLVSSKV